VLLPMSGAGLAHIKLFLTQWPCLKKPALIFGFAATNNAQNSGYLGSDEFIDNMIERGCSAGLITEYIPCGQEAHSEWILNPMQREQFQQHILETRSVKPIVLVQFPQDEYGEANICSGAGRVSLHINSQGGIEPCPFVPLSCDNIRQEGLMTALKSSFLASIRSQPDLLARDRLACSLYEHYSEVEALLDQNNTVDVSISG
jgi:MoaA/NifB/PqqE/SkfB family radical SAM enzyme